MTNETTAQNLLSCPFCGGEPIEEIEHDKAWLYCPDCWASARMVHELDRALCREAWNNRAIDPQIAEMQADIRMLREALSIALAITEGCCDCFEQSPKEEKKEYVRQALTKTEKYIQRRVESTNSGVNPNKYGE